jgi:hypothetical protein
MHQNNGKALFKRITITSDMTAAHYHCLAISVGFQEGNQVQLPNPTETRVKLPTLQPS